MVCESSNGDCPFCRLKVGLASAMANEDTGAASDVLELLLDAVEQVRWCRSLTDGLDALDAADSLVALVKVLYEVAGAEGDDAGRAAK